MKRRSDQSSRRPVENTIQLVEVSSTSDLLLWNFNRPHFGVFVSWCVLLRRQQDVLWHFGLPTIERHILPRLIRSPVLY